MSDCLTDPNVPLVNTIAALLWIGGIAVIVTDLFVPPDIHGVGIVLCGMGGVLTIRAFLCRLVNRERRAFDVGREVGRNEADTESSVRRLPDRN